MDYGSYIDEINAIVSKKTKKKTQEQIFDKKKNKENVVNHNPEEMNTEYSVICKKSVNTGSSSRPQLAP